MMMTPFIIATLATLLILAYLNPSIVTWISKFLILWFVGCSIVYTILSIRKRLKNRNNRAELLKYSKNNEFKLIKLENRKELTNQEVESLLSRTKYITKTKFPNSRIKYPFIAGYSLDLIGERFPFNIVVPKGGNVQMYTNNGDNLETKPIDVFPGSIDFHDNKNVNYNVNIFGSPGTGRTQVVKEITTELVEKNIKTVIIDQHGDFKDVTKKLGGTYVYASDICINLFDLNEDEIMDSDEDISYYINEKVESIVNFIDLVAQEWMKKKLTSNQKAVIISIVRELYKDIGINYSNKDTYLGEDKNQMPTFLGFCNKLDTLIEDANKYNENLAISRAEYDSLYLLFNRVDEYILDVQALAGLSLILKECREDGLLRIFNGQTSDVINFDESDLIIFDLSDMPEGTQLIYIYGVLYYTWEKFGKKHPSIKKKIIFNKMYDDNIYQNEIFSGLLLKIRIRARMRDCGICIVYQGIENIVDDINYSQILKNAGINIFLKQDQFSIDKLKRFSHISEKDEQFLQSANRGEMLIKIGDKTIYQCINYPTIEVKAND
ncbi:DUF87 domain-containing protein [Tissierella carlieri]|uniref:DUF87 domain-containing protein n=1 Tax=Tissierella carlieri TaxID=689904 RepID=A0ABT1SEG8_9FIRM|nr:DUF87 domain-containing protein [Tissierella carlieri]MCQ4924882.1 DUF87 domain-containing protein [Tissierella carlieri]